MKKINYILLLSAFLFFTSTSIVLAYIPAVTTFGSRVGISSTSTPYAVLSVAGFNQGSNPLLIVASSSNSLATTTYMYMDKNGKLGLGTNNPLVPFQVTSLSGNTNGMWITTNDFNGSNVGSIFSVDFGASSGNTYSRISALSPGFTDFNNLIFQSGGGRVGIGTTSPATTLAVSNVSNPTNGFFSVASTTSTTNQTLYKIDSNGHEIWGGVVPVPGTCGTSPLIIGGNDNVFTIHTGSGVLTTCTVNFAKSWPNPPVCLATVDAAVSTAVDASTTVSSVTVTAGATIASVSISFRCAGY